MAVQANSVQLTRATEKSSACACSVKRLMSSVARVLSRSMIGEGFLMMMVYVGVWWSWFAVDRWAGEDGGEEARGESQDGSERPRSMREERKRGASTWSQSQQTGLTIYPSAFTALHDLFAKSCSKYVRMQNDADKSLAPSWQQQPRHQSSGYGTVP